MSLIDNSNILLREQLGKGSADCFTTGAQTGKDYYAVHFVTTSVVTVFTSANIGGASSLQTTIPAGTVIFGRVTAITMTSGVAIGYTETDGDTSN